MDSDEEKITALHEAGHALAHVRLGINQYSATIESLDSNLAGFVLADDSVLDRDDAEAQVLALYAGYAATIVAGAPRDVAEVGCNDDFSKADVLISNWNIGNAEGLIRRAVELMSRPENITAAQFIAEELRACRTLSIELIDVLVDVADGKVTPNEYQNFKHMLSLIRTEGCR